MSRIGILLFDGVEELDFVGPYEVFGMTNEVFRRGGKAPPHEVMLLAERDDSVLCAKGMRVLPDATIANVVTLDILLVPGGQGTRRAADSAALLAWIARISAGAEWVSSVCTDALLLAAAGPARGKRVTTYWGFVEALRKRGEVGEVVEGIRYVRDGKLVTAAGVSAGVDMALWLVGQLHDSDLARKVQHAMESDPVPPYAADV